MTPPEQPKAQHKIEEERHDHVGPYRRYGRISALAMSSVFIAGLACIAEASANQNLPTVVSSSGASPVRIDSCRAALIDKPGPGGVIPSILLTKHDFYIAAAVDFTNIAPQPIEAVRFTFDVHDTFDEVTQGLGLDSLGTYAPGVQIHARQNLAGTVGAVSSQNASQGPLTVACSVEDVRFSDGRVWKKGDRTAVSPGLYYPPTPSPTSSP